MTEPGRPRVVIVADDLIWATRLDRSSGPPAPSRWWPAPSPDSRMDSAGPTPALIDLATRALEPFAAIGAARARAWRSLAVGPHEDLAARKRALADGAGRVYAYRKLFDDGPRTIAAWLARASDVSEPGRPIAARSRTHRDDDRRDGSAESPRRATASGSSVPGADRRRRTGRPAHRRRAGPRVPHRLPGHAARAADDAGHPGPGPGDLVVPRLEAPRRWRARRSRRRRRGRDLGGNRGSGRARRTLVGRAIGRSPAELGRLALSDRLWAMHVLRIQRATPGGATRESPAPSCAGCG